MNAYNFANEPETRGTPERSRRDKQPIDWPEPIDILADPQLTGLATVDATCLPRSILALATAEGARLQVDPCHIAALTIGATSAVIPDNWRIRLKVNDHGWTQHPSIWVAVVAESGRKKTDCFKAATRGIFKVEASSVKNTTRKWRSMLEEHEAWEAKAKKERGQEPKPPAEVRLATDDFTPEVLCDLLQSSTKVLLRSDELATVLGAYERYQKAGTINAGRAHMLALYDGGPRRIDRVLRGKMFVENWSAVPVGHIQPAKVRQLVAGLSDDGLLQRFMLVMPPRVDAGDPDDDDIATDWSAIDRYAKIVEILFSMQPPETQGARREAGIFVVEAGHDVHAIRRRLFRLIERIEADPILPAPLKEATSKWRGLLARLALVFHCVELAEMRLAGERPDPVTMRTLKAETVEKACNFIMRIVVPEHVPVPHRDRQHWHQRDPRQVDGGLHAQPAAAEHTARDIGRAYREIRGERAEIIATMDLLDHAGWVTPQPDRPKDTAWLVNPRVHVVSPRRRQRRRPGARRAGAGPGQHRGAGPMRRVPTVTRAVVTFVTPRGAPDAAQTLGLRASVQNVTCVREMRDQTNGLLSLHPHTSGSQYSFLSRA